MTIKETALKCSQAADTCIQVGDPFFSDMFEAIITEMVKSNSALGIVPEGYLEPKVKS